MQTPFLKLQNIARYTVLNTSGISSMSWFCHVFIHNRGKIFTCSANTVTVYTVRWLVHKIWTFNYYVVPILSNGMPTVCLKTSAAKTTEILSTRNSRILLMSSSEYLFSESKCSFTKYVSACSYTKYLYLQLPFLKMKAFWIILVSLFFFKFLVRYGCIKRGTIWRLDACYKVDSWRFKIF